MESVIEREDDMLAIDLESTSEQFVDMSAFKNSDGDGSQSDIKYH